jgi:hypothetical protein
MLFPAFSCSAGLRKIAFFVSARKSGPAAGHTDKRTAEIPASAARSDSAEWQPAAFSGQPAAFRPAAAF